jgi:hypothetical protein
VGHPNEKNNGIEKESDQEAEEGQSPRHTKPLKEIHQITAGNQD